MASYIIINDSADELVPGDVRIYDGPSKALASLEEYDIEDSAIHIYNEDGFKCVLERAGNSKHAMRLHTLEEKFPQLEMLLLSYAKADGIEIREPEGGLHHIIEELFVFNPNPYT